MHDERREQVELREILNGIKDLAVGQREDLRYVASQLRRILKLLELLFAVETIDGFTLTQLYTTQGDTPMATITGIKVGATGQFTASPLPVGATLPPGVLPTWTSDNTTDVTISVDGTGLNAAILVAPTSVATSFNLTIALPDGSASSTFAIPVLPATVKVTGFDLTQTA